MRSKFLPQGNWSGEGDAESSKKAAADVWGGATDWNSDAAATTTKSEALPSGFAPIESVLAYIQEQFGGFYNVDNSRSVHLAIMSPDGETADEIVGPFLKHPRLRHLTLTLILIGYARWKARRSHTEAETVLRSRRKLR